MVYLFTILMPTVMIHLYRRYQGWNLIELGLRERRMVPYVISIICYLSCVYVMERLHFPHFMAAIVIAGLAVQIVCALRYFFAYVMLSLLHAKHEIPPPAKVIFEDEANS